MQQTTMVAIAAALGLSLGVGAGFLATRSPSESSQTRDSGTNSSPSDPSSPSTSIPSTDASEQAQPERTPPRRRNPDPVTVSPSGQPSVEPSPLAFDAKATHCPPNGGGGDLISLYLTDHHLIYICQGGEGRADWRELDYYAVSRTHPDDWIRLRAFVTSGPGVYAENGTYRYEIDPTSLTVRENSSILLQEPVLRCKGSCS